MPKAEYQGTVLADSENTVALEGNQYFPRESVHMDLFSDSPTEYTCPWKGEAAYYNLTIDGQEVSRRRLVVPGTQGRRQRDCGVLSVR